ncbi:hypothetical protein BDFB_005982 [Asbolus verrucosus]|uniref:Uncharacterized protein n=1 Tax=Asbolus verrucosus TaxID=1661398 RepID=A0A482W3F3_ASBVE|nr:hypothetical protein BDFB_005982 [Asbolus verrucosus]
MGAGGFIRNPGWEIFSSDDLMDEDDVLYDVNSLIDSVLIDGEDMELNTEVVLLFPPADEDLDDDFDDVDNDDEEEDDEDYVPSDSLDDDDLVDDDFDDDNATVLSSDDSVPELTN